MTHHCPEPWEYLEVLQDGRVFICCNGRQRQPIGSIHDATLLDLWRGPKAEEVRHSILSNTFTNCHPCRYLDLKFARVRTQTEHDASHLGTIHPENFPRRLWLLIDRTCQLHCPSCRRIPVHGQDPLTRANINALRDLVLRDPLLPHVETLWLDGSGEPLMSPTHLALIENSALMLPLGPNLGILTNGHRFPNVYESLKHVSRARIRHVTVSVDAARPSTYEALRPPGKWRGINHALNHIARLKKSGDIETFKMVMTVQRDNFREAVEFCIWARALGAQPWFTAVTNWGTWSEYEYAQRAVHDPRHYAHAELAEIFNNPCFSEPGVLQWVMPR